ncbi:FBP domain-containing protein [Kocuria kalidii]|uniref:FBP domain-containing protein n=1 Tax=Kocuria kalidii TaxID=3376283 RepID=UPI0037A877B6
MHSLTDQQIRTCFINCSRLEAADLPLPADLDQTDWDRKDYLGWRDPRSPRRRGFVVIPTPHGPVGVVLYAAKPPTRSAKCAWCRDGQLSHPAVIYVAQRVGQAGHWGSTVGTRICENFQCSANVRQPPLCPPEGTEIADAVAERIAELQRRAQGFLVSVNS